MQCGECGRDVVGDACPSCDAPVFSRTSRAGQVLASWPRRVGATLVDWFALFLLMLVLSVFADYFISATIFSVACAYYFVSLLRSAKGQTVGNIAANTCVRSATNGGTITFPQSVARFATSALPILVTVLVPIAILQIVLWGYVLLDSLFPLWDPQQRTLHDKVAGTVVVRVTHDPRGLATDASGQ